MAGYLSNIRINSYNCIHSYSGRDCSWDNSQSLHTVEELVRNHMWNVRTKGLFKDISDIAKQRYINDLSFAFATVLNQPNFETNPWMVKVMTEINDNNNVKNLRKDLDDKLSDIYNLDKSALSEYKIHYESTLMSGLLWGTLAGTAMYYIMYS